MAQRLDVRYVNFTTAGSSALQAEPVLPLKTLVLPKKKRAKRVTLFIDPVAIAGIAVAAFMMILMTIGVTSLISARSDEAVMAAYVNTLQTENNALQAEFEESLDLEELERNALALGMVPASHAEQIKIQVTDPATEENSGALANFFNLLTDLFA